jgi:nicotinate-nucleotide adenylyltransferase
MQPIRMGLGLLGGSFDPIHRGHLQLARDALADLQLTQVRFIPANRPWQKRPLTDARHRSEMVRLAIAGEENFALDPIETDRDGPTYTIDTLRALRAGVGPEVPLVLIMGSDQLRNLDTWREWRHLLDFAHLAVARRNDEALDLNPALQAFFDANAAPAAAIRQQTFGRIVVFEMTPNEASATEIRALLRQAPSFARDARLAALVPAPVLDYIRHHSLY